MLYFYTSGFLEFSGSVGMEHSEAVVQICYVKKVFLKLHKIHRKTPVPESLFQTLLKKKLWHRCFPVNFVNYLRTPFLYRTLPVAVSRTLV